MDTIVYIDGFNLYYGAVQFTEFKWLNLHEMCRRLLAAKHRVVAIKYFTADVSGATDPDAPMHQQTYLRALQTLPNIEIVKGHFLAHRRLAPLADDPQFLVEIIRTEEKGSDVNLATWLLVDAFRQRFDCAVIISNDSDLHMPMRIVKEELGKCVGLLNPHRKRASKQLTRCATFVKQIRRGVLRDSQFPDELSDANGTFSRPEKWRTATSRARLPRRRKEVSVVRLPSLGNVR